jgi:uncharacterized membrane protein YheB (UPF0754 family)
MVYHQLVYVAVMGLIGGLIGYVTNVVAVEMLFRPERPRCLYNGRLCVQGLVPARKDEIAERLAVIAARYALSGRARERFTEALSGRVKEAVRDTIMRQLRRMAPPGLPVSAMLSVVADATAEAVTPRLISLFDEASSKIDVAGIVREEFRMMPAGEIERAFKQLAGRELRFIQLAGLVLGLIVGVAEGVFMLVFLS